VKWFFNIKKRKEKEDATMVWKKNFSDCVATPYLPGYSVCHCNDSDCCRFVAKYAGMTLCSNPDHKSFIPPNSEPYNPKLRKFKG